MIAMRPRLLLAEPVRRLRGWLLPATLLALTPKCVLCVLAYAGAGIVLGLGGPEICGAAGPERPWASPVLWAALVAAAILVRRNRALKRTRVYSPGSTSSSSTSKIRPDN